MNVVDILNVIRENASTEYSTRIPEATRENLSDIRFAMLSSDNVQVANEFVSTLLNRLIKTVLISKRFENPLAPLKKGNKPLGDTVEEVFTNFIKAQPEDATGANLLKRNLPDTKTLYHRMNYQVHYPITVDRNRLSKAFSSYANLETYINDTISKLYDSAELDEFINMKQLIKSALEKNAVVKIHVDDPLTSEANAKNFIKGVKTVSSLMKFPSTKFNAYLEAQKTDTIPITTLSRYDEQVLILDTATDIGVSLDVLASTFNMTLAEFNKTKKIVIDAFPDSNIRAMLVDKNFFQVYDDDVFINSFDNPLGVYKNYYLHIWQTQAFSILTNAVCFTTEEVA